MVSAIGDDGGGDDGGGGGDDGGGDGDGGGGVTAAPSNDPAVPSPEGDRRSKMGKRTKKARMLRWLKVALFGVVALMTAFGVGTLIRAPVSWPFDRVFNLGAAVLAPEWAAPDDGKVRVVFVQHGLWRTSTSMDRLARSLAANGYEVINEGYPSTEDRIEGHARRLRDVVEARYAKGPVDEISFVGHSMGGLVIQEYLRRDDAREPAACCYLATPHRGAILADKRRHWFLFQMVMGEQSARQLATTDPFHRQAIPFGERTATLVARREGHGNRSIPGPDDGTVGCREATFAGAAVSREFVGLNHTRITIAPDAIRSVLRFLRTGALSAD
ncbi:MAG: esterase/lipase family protein [Planctomycetota bacterium]